MWVHFWDSIYCFMEESVKIIVIRVTWVSSIHRLDNGKFQESKEPYLDQWLITSHVQFLLLIDTKMQASHYTNCLTSQYIHQIMERYEHQFKFQIKEEGIYIFGGKGLNDLANNDLRILKTGKKSLEWITPDVIGRPPSARYSHTMVYSDYLNCLIVFGGRNDNNLPLKQATCFNDIHILMLSKQQIINFVENLEWR